MLKSFTEKFYQGLTGIKPGHLVNDESEQAGIWAAAQNLRCKDYVFPVTVKAGVVTTIPDATTTARWFFLVTGVATYWERGGRDAPRVKIGWKPFVNETCFNTEPEYLDAVTPSLVFGREFYEDPISSLNLHFEEYKNLYYSLNQRVTLSVDVIPTFSGQYDRGAVIISGLEFFTGE